MKRNIEKRNIGKRLKLYPVLTWRKAVSGGVNRIKLAITLRTLKVASFRKWCVTKSAGG